MILLIRAGSVDGLVARTGQLGSRMSHMKIKWEYGAMQLSEAGALHWCREGEAA